MAIERVGNWFSKGGTALGITQEVYDAEAFAMTRGLEIALKSPMAPHASAIHLRLDNLSIAKNAGKILNGTYIYRIPRDSKDVACKIKKKNDCSVNSRTREHYNRSPRPMPQAKYVEVITDLVGR